MYFAFKVVDAFVSIVLFLIGHVKGYNIKFIAQLNQLKIGLAQETKETKEMLAVYKRFANAQATKDEMAIANKQLRDIMKAMGLGVLLVLPFSFLTLPVLVKIGEKLGIAILPSAFAKDQDQENPNRNV